VQETIHKGSSYVVQGAGQWDGGQKCYVTGCSWLQTLIQISNCASLQINDMRNGMVINLADRKKQVRYFLELTSDNLYLPLVAAALVWPTMPV
jgi:hypothetical protein